MRRIAYFLLIAVVLAGCKSSKHLMTTVPEVTAPSYLASKLQLTIPSKNGSMSVGGTMKMKSHEMCIRDRPQCLFSFKTPNSYLI